MEDLDTFIIGINSQIFVLDEEISKAVQAQNILGEQASKVLLVKDLNAWNCHSTDDLVRIVKFNAVMIIKLK